MAARRTYLANRQRLESFRKEKPYGCYLQEGGKVIFFNRDYQPLDPTEDARHLSYIRRVYFYDDGMQPLSS